MDPTELILTAVFNGMGTAIGLYIFTEYLKPHIDKARERKAALEARLAELSKMEVGNNGRRYPQ